LAVEITREEFEAWRQNAVTEAVFDVLRSKTAEAQRQWLDASWAAPRIDDQLYLLLADLRGGAKLAHDIVNMTFEDLQSEIGDGSED